MNTNLLGRIATMTHGGAKYEIVALWSDRSDLWVALRPLKREKYSSGNLTCMFTSGLQVHNEDEDQVSDPEM